MHRQNEDIIKSLMVQYQQRIFALVLYLVGQDQDAAYDICASSFVETIQERSSMEQKEAFLLRLVSVAVGKCRNVKTIPTFDAIEFLTITSAEKEPLRIVLKALLLRFQLNLSYSEIGTVMQISDSNARTKTIQARTQMDNEIERILSNA